MNIQKYEPAFPPIEQETKMPLVSLSKGDHVELFGQEYEAVSRKFGFNEDACFTVYYLKK